MNHFKCDEIRTIHYFKVRKLNFLKYLYYLACRSLHTLHENVNSKSNRKGNLRKFELVCASKFINLGNIVGLFFRRHDHIEVILKPL